MNEEEIQTAMTCASLEGPRMSTKFFMERSAQTVFTYTPAMSNTAIREELFNRNPDHEEDGADWTQSHLTRLSYNETDKEATLVEEMTLDAEEDIDDVEKVEDLEGGDDADKVEAEGGDNSETVETKGGDDAGNVEEAPESGAEEQAVEEQPSAEEGDVSSLDDKNQQTNITLGTGDTAPPVPTADGNTQESETQTKFGGYAADQSDTLIIEELQTRQPVHSQEVVEDAGTVAETDGNTKPVQTVFSYAPDMSNSQLVDELENAMPRHSIDGTEASQENADAVLAESTPGDEDSPPMEVPQEGGEEPPSTVIEEEEGGTGTATQTGIKCGPGRCPPSEGVDQDELSKNTQTVFGGYNVDQSDTRIIEELQFTDPLHSRQGSLTPVEEAEAPQEPEEPVAPPEDVAEGEEAGAAEAPEDETQDEIPEEPREEGSPDESPAGEDENQEETPAAEETDESVDVVLAVEVRDGEEDEAAVQTMMTFADGEEDKGTGVQTMMTCAPSDEHPPPVTRLVEQNVQTVFTYDPDASNTWILEELKSRQPDHEGEGEGGDEMEKEREGEEVAEFVVEEGEGIESGDEAAKEDGGEEAVDAVVEEGEAVEGGGEEEQKEEGEGEVTEAVVEEGEALEGGDEEQKEEGGGEAAEVVVEEGEAIEGGDEEQTEEGGDEAAEDADDEGEGLESGEETEKEEGGEVVELIVEVKEEGEDGGENEGEDVQTDIVLGTGSTKPGSENEKIQQTYFSYAPDMSNTMVLEELQTGQPIHSQLEVLGSESEGDENYVSTAEDLGEEPDAATTKASNTYFTYDPGASDTQVLEELQHGDPVHSDEALFNDDWDKNESSGGSEVEVRDIDATYSRTTKHQQEEDAVDVVLVIKEGDDDEGMGAQTVMTFGQGGTPPGDVRVMFNLKVGEAVNVMEMRIPQSGIDPEDAALKATFEAGVARDDADVDRPTEASERIRVALPVQMNIACESRVDESGREVMEPVVDLIFQRPDAKSDVSPPGNDVTATEEAASSPGEDNEVTAEIDAPLEAEDAGEVEDDMVEESPEGKRQIEIQTDIVLGNLLFSDSISSVVAGGAEDGYETASEGHMQDEELQLPTPPLEDPSSRVNVPWADGSLDDVETGESYEDQHLLVVADEVVDNQYVQLLAPGSFENLPLAEKSLKQLTKITTAELLDVPDRVSSLSARHTAAQRKVKQVTGNNLHRWGFQHANPQSNVTIVPQENASKMTTLTEGGLIAASQSVRTTATRVVFEFEHSQIMGTESTDGRAPGVRSRLAFQVNRDRDNASLHMATVDLRESTRPSRVMFGTMSGEMKSTILEPGGTPLEIPVARDPLVLKVPLSRDETEIKERCKVPFTIARDGDPAEVLMTKELEPGGSAMHFTLPLGDGNATMHVVAKLEDNSEDPEAPELISMVTTLEGLETGGAKPPCECRSRRVKRKAPQPTEIERAPVGESKAKTVTAVLIKNGVPGEKQTKVLRPGGSPLNVMLPSKGGIPVQATIALDSQTEDTDTTPVGAELKTKVSCKVIQDGVEGETKSKMMGAGGSPLKFEMPVGEGGGRLTAKVRIPKEMEGEENMEEEFGEGEGECACPLSEECVCDTTMDRRTKRSSPTGDPCFDAILKALETYEKEMDPLKKTLDTITEKVRELNMPELAGIGEPPSMSYHSLDELDPSNLPAPLSIRHSITMRAGGKSRVATTVKAGGRRPRPATTPARQVPCLPPPSYHQPTCPVPHICPLSPPAPPPPPRLPSQQPSGCQFTPKNLTVETRDSGTLHMSFQIPPEILFQGATRNQRYPEDMAAMPAVNISSKVYREPPYTPVSKESDALSSCGCYNPDTGYDEYGRQTPRSPIAEMYVKLAQGSKTCSTYEEDEESGSEYAELGYCGGGGGGGGGGYQRGRMRRPPKKGRTWNREDSRRRSRGSRGCSCSASSTDVGTSTTAIDLEKKDSYWCDPEDVTGSTRPTDLRACARR